MYKTERPLIRVDEKESLAGEDFYLEGMGRCPKLRPERRRPYPNHWKGQNSVGWWGCHSCGGHDGTKEKRRLGCFHWKYAYPGRNLSA